uniref:JmjC domain-containing protein n=1 Tax=Schistosoma mansoni TaxID=6183 RepID=A0A3Q0KLE8_SCHMA
MTASSQNSCLNSFDIRKASVDPSKEGLSGFSQQPAFNAYPLESSPNLLIPTNDVIYMPLNPTNVPLSLQRACASNETIGDDTQSYGHPICHGFIFPNSEVGSNDPELNQINIPSMKNHINDVSYNIPSQSSSNVDTNAQKHLQLLLLQKLIELQLAEHYNSLKDTLISTEDSNNESQNPKLLPCFVKNSDFDASSNPVSIVSNENSDMSTFLVPVKAKFEGESGLSLHITPRDDISQSTQGSPVTVACPSQPIVLYPFSVQQDNSTEDTSPASQAVPDASSGGPTAQTFTMKDIDHCIRRGSLDFTAEPSNDIVESIRGRTRPGFVLLSVRHEKINAENKISPTSEKHFQESNPSISTSASLETKKTKSITISKKLPRKRLKHMKSDAELRKRSLRGSSKSLPRRSENAEMSPSPVELTEDDLKALSPQSRFRVTRFADKKQAWIAPAKAGFTVHDLWTTKLPEYVLRCAEHLKISGSGLNLQQEKFGEIPYSLDDIINGHCLACEKSPPQPCSYCMEQKFAQ